MRNATIDIAKGIGILLVVFSHNWIIFIIKGELFNTIYSFQLLLFFYLAGIFYKHSTSFTTLFRTKADSLLKPYFVVLMGVGIVKALMGEPFTLQYFLGILYANGNTIAWVALWFLPHLFAIFIFVWVINRLVKDVLKMPKLLWGIALFFLLAGGKPLEWFWQRPLTDFGGPETLFGKPALLPGLPFNLDVILITSGYFLLGYLTSNFALNFKINAYLLIASIGVFAGLHYFFNEVQDLDFRYYGNPVICLLQAITAFYIVLSISSVIGLSPPLTRIFTYIGSATLIMLLFHARFEDMTYDYLYAHNPDHPLRAGAVAFVVAVIMPLLLFYIIKRNKWLSVLLLPIKTSKPVEKPIPVDDK